MRLGPLVSASGIPGELLLGLHVASDVYHEHGERLTVSYWRQWTARKNGCVYVGISADVRLPKRHPSMIVRELGKQLGREYEVSLARTHVHLVYEPKNGGNPCAGAKQS